MNKRPHPHDILGTRRDRFAFRLAARFLDAVMTDKGNAAFVAVLRAGSQEVARPVPVSRERLGLPPKHEQPILIRHGDPQSPYGQHIDVSGWGVFRTPEGKWWRASEVYAWEDLPEDIFPLRVIG